MNRKKESMIELITLPHYDGLELPKFESTDAAGVDIRAAHAEDVILQPGESMVIPSGLKMHIGSHHMHSMFVELGVYGEIVPRSGLGFKHFVRLANTVGVIDADYQGEIFIKLRNEGDERITVKRGDRICQMIFKPYFKGIQFDVVPEFSETTDRGAKGIGSSGVK